ncbi:MAG TPA: ABC transporter permease [Candidatus Acidoferrales bacterium]|nr:ABC transporter permease [Candidatus Acidoferrales bacterium]
MKWWQIGKRDADVEREIQSDLALEEEEQRDRGVSREEARHAAMRAFGNPTLISEQTRAVWSWNALENLLRDLQISVRTLFRSVGFSSIAILVIAVGMGATISLFTVVWSVLLKPLPFDRPEQLVRLYESSDRFPENVVSPGIYGEWKRESRSFSNLALYKDWPQYNLSEGGALPEKVRATICSWDLFATLGVQPRIGRSFTPDDDQPSANGAVILGWALWKRRFAGDASVIGRKINLDAKPYTVIGVMPRWFAFPEQKVQIFLPAYHESTPEEMAKIDNHGFVAIGRLKPVVTREQAAQEVSAIVRRIHDAHLDLPFVSSGAGIRPLIDYLVGDVRPALYMLLAATGCMLLIACLNVANLLTARSAARRREIAIRTALGGGRFRLIREQLIETLVLFSVGGAAGLALAYAALRWLVMTRSDLVRVESIGVDAVVVVTVAGLVLICALLAGLIPVLASRSESLLAPLQESSRGSTSGPSRTGVRKVLVGAEVAFTVVLLVSAGLLLKSYMRLRSNDLGCATDNILTMHFTLPEVQYSKPAQRVAFFDELLARVRAVPGVDAAGLVRAVPGEGYFGDGGVTIVEHPTVPQGQTQLAIVRWADPGYFGSLRIPFLRGRTSRSDQRLDSANEAIISSEFARQYFPSEDPIGKHLIGFGRRSYEIVGVVGDTRYQVATPPEPTMYFPIDAGTFSPFESTAAGAALVVRATRDPESLAVPVQKVIQQMDRELAVSDVLTMNQIINKSSLDANFEATLLAALAGISLLLAAVGLFGVLAYLVTQRRTEIGIRLALGAQREHILHLMLLDGLAPAFGGAAAGSLLAVAATQLIRSSLYATKPLDPGVFAGVIGLLFGVATTACLLPAWRASRIQPATVLRSE